MPRANSKFTFIMDSANPSVTHLKGNDGEEKPHMAQGSALGMSQQSMAAGVRNRTGFRHTGGQQGRKGERVGYHGAEAQAA